MSDLTVKISDLIGPDTVPADDDLLSSLAETVRDVRQHAHEEPADDIYCANLKAWMGQRTGAVLARLLRAGTIIARQRELVAEAAELVAPCPAPNPLAGEEGCRHGRWPCRETTLAWKLRGFDPETERTRIMSQIRSDMIAACPEPYEPDTDEAADGPS